jgi:hypothetical protein
MSDFKEICERHGTPNRNRYGKLILTDELHLADKDRGELIAMVKASRAEFQEMLLAEYNYWKESDCESSVSAMGALSNVLAALYRHKPTHHTPEQSK